MDALKKAEKEKKRAAKRLEEVEADDVPVMNDQEQQSSNHKQNIFTETAELSLEPITEHLDTIGAESNVDDAISENVVKSKEETQVLENIDIESEDLTLENEVLPEALDKTQQENIDLNDTTIIEGLSTEDVSAPFDDTFHGVLLEEEQEVELYEETLPGVPAETLAKDLGGGEFQPTPVAAQTVFTASKGSTQKSRSVMTWSVLGVLALLAVVSFSVFYYFTITPLARELPSPLVARGIESIPTSPPQIEPISKPDVVTGTIISAEPDSQPEQAKEIIVNEQNAKQIVSDFESSQEQIANPALLEQEDLAQITSIVESVEPEVYTDKIAAEDESE